MTPAPSRPRHRRPAALLLAVLMAATGLVAATPDVAAADTTMTFDGRGWGHGRGMSQYGAQGYATKYGWTNNQILDHYYGNTHFGTWNQASHRPIDAGYVRVRLTKMDNQNIIRIGVDSTAAMSINGASASIPSTHKSVELRRSGSSWQVWSGPSCGGPYTRRDTTSSSVVTVGKGGSGQLFLCRPDGVRVWYPGSLRGWTDGTVARTVNITTAEAYLRGVVPNESFPSWDLDALMAQAVAARSYLMAGDTRHGGYADTCDSTTCQVYEGHHQQAPGGSKTPSTHPNTDLAISNTTGEVRLMDGTNRIARTEFSSSTGGWTAGGTFPAVQDLGDSISPRHTWTRAVSVRPLELAYGGGSTLTAIEVTRRNGLGAMGGRVLEARLRFSNGTTKLTTGNDIRSRLGLWSDWFATSCTTEGDYIQATYQLFLRRAASSGEVESWCGTVRSGHRSALTHALAVSDEWAGVQIAGLYRKILGREADAGGRAYWLDRVRSGFRIEDIAAYFYGGTEYFDRSGSTNAGFVDRLYRDLLGRRPDSGRTYWIGQLDSGRLTRSGVASNFYASIESRESRVDSLYRQILGRRADASGLSYWSEQLLRLGEVSLAAYLAASAEYYKRVT